jgi:hypothetical protein
MTAARRRAAVVAATLRTRNASRCTSRSAPEKRLDLREDVEQMHVEDL